MADNFFKIRKGLNLGSLASDPSNPAEGDFYTNSTTNSIRVYINGAFRNAVMDDAAQTLSNKSLVDSSVFVVDATDNTIKVKIDAAGTTGTTTTIASSQTANRTITLPDATDTLVGKATTDTLTNKTLAVGSNHVVGATGKVPQFNATTGDLESSTITNAELAHLHGVTTDIQTQLNAITGSGITGLTGDISATGPGNVSATVNFVGASTSTEIHTATVATLSASNTNAPNAIVKRDGSGNFSAGTITANLTGNVTGNVSGTAASITGNLTGDVTSTGMATTVASVGGSSASSVHTAEQAANAATSLNTNSTIVKRDASGNFSAGTITANVTGNVSGTASNVTGTVAIANGGTGATTQQGAINALAGTQSAGKYLRSDGTNTTLSTIQAADVPTLNQNTTGTASNVTGTVAIANGGTGQTTASAAFDALSPSTTKGDIVVRGASGNVRVPVGSNNQVLVADNSQAAGVKWSNVAGGSGGSGTGDDLNSLKYQVSFFEDFTQNPAASLTLDTSAGKTDATLYDVNNTYFRLAYDATKTVTGTGTAMTLSGAPSFTVKAGDVIIVGTQARRITAITSQTVYTIESAFSSDPSAAAACVSQAVYTVDLNNYAGDGMAPSAAISSTFNEVLVDYADTTTLNDTIFDIGITPHIAFSASVDGSTWSANKSRTVNVTDTNQSTSFSTAGSNLYIRFFANKTSGSGSVNLLDFKAYWQAVTAQQYGAFAAQAFALLNGAGTPVNCSLSTVNGKTRITLGFSYTNGVNVGAPNGQLEVTINGQKIPRFINSTLTPDAYYTEIDGTHIDLDSDYSSLAYEIEVLKRVGVVDTSNNNASRIAALEQGGVSKGTGKNYITLGNFENSTASGWSLAHTALSGVIPTSTSFTAAAGTLSISTVNSGQLAGTYSLQMASSAATTVGDMLISDPYSIDISDQAKVLSYKFSYKIAAGTANFSGTASNSFAVYIYDVVNAVWIQPAGCFNLVQSSGVGIAQGTFQTPSNMTQFRLAVVSINATSAAVTMLFDDFYVGPQALAFGPAVTDWKDNSSAYSVSAVGTVTNAKFFERQVGDTIEVEGTFTTGTVTTSTFQINIPRSVDSSKFSTANNIVGDITQLFNGAAVGYPGTPAGPWALFYDGSTTNAIFLSANSGGGSLSKQQGAYLNSSTTHTFKFRYPAAGLSSNTVMSADSDTRVVSAIVTGTPASAAANATIIFPTVAKDTHGAYSTTTGQYTVPVTGYYEITAFIVTSTPSNSWMNAYLDGVIQVPTMGYISSTVGVGSGSTTVYANAGQKIDLRISNSTGTFGSGNNGLSIQRVSGPATVAASETVACRYSDKSGLSIGTGDTLLSLTTKDFDTHNAYSAGTFTAPASGKYSIKFAVVTAGVSLTSGQSIYAKIFKNGVSYNYSQVLGTGGGSLGYIVTLADTVNLLAGDTLKLYAGSQVATATNGGQPTFFCIERIGN